MKIDIPQDWNFTKLGELGQFLKGKGIAKSEVLEDGIPCVRYGEIYTNHNDYIKAFTSFTTQESANQSTRLEYGDILFAGSGETLEDIGKSVAFVDEFEAYSGGDIIILRGHNQDPKFLGFLLNTDFVSRQTFQLGQGHSVVHIYSSGLKNVKIPLPPLHEQQKIATILSTWDKALDKLTQLIAAKEQRKKGLMQQLLSSKKRFAGFKDEWKEVKLGDLAEIDKNSLKSNTDPKYFFKYISLSDVNEGTICENLTEYNFSNAPSRAKRIVKSNSVIMATVRPNLQAFALVKDSKDIIVSTGFAVIDHKENLSPYYLIQYLFSKHITNQLEALIVGTNYPAINSSDVRNLKLKLPNIQEQQKIASVLSAADKEIELLKIELERLQQQKKGLMQVLLTGEVRVKIN